jgi:hypothetical protein
MRILPLDDMLNPAGKQTGGVHGIHGVITE